ncbi:MAG: hypothetical protein CBD47_03880, partial [Synechococcus sp. TMED187]
MPIPPSQCGQGGGQYVGIRFQDVDVPAGAIIKQAHLKFTVDESTNAGDHGLSALSSGQVGGDWTA